jgi:hypothetical protein
MAEEDIPMTTNSWTLMVLTAALATTPAWHAPASAAPGAGETVASADAAPRTVTLPAGTRLRVRLDTSHASNTSRVEDTVRGRLIAPVVVDGVTVFEANSEVTGHVVSARPSGKVKGRGYLAVRFSEVREDGANYDITTRTWAREAPGTKKKDAATIGVPAGVGAVVGGVVDGKKGAAIGAGVGAAAGTGVVLSTAGKEVALPRGATLIVRLAAPLTVRVPA